MLTAKEKGALNVMNPTAQDVQLGTELFFAQSLMPGDRYFVDSTGGTDANNRGHDGTSWEQAYATLDYAINQCSSDNGDVIYVSPYHSEDLDADAAVALDTKGVTVIGVRVGNYMPTFDITGTAGSMKISANKISIINLEFTGGVDASTGGLEITGDDVVVKDCRFRDVTGQAQDFLITNNAVRLLIDGLVFLGSDSDGGDTAIMLDECDDAEIKNCRIIGNFDLGAIECRTTASADIWVHDCVIKTYGSEDLCIKDTATGSTGIMGPNIYMRLADNADNITEAITGATFVVMSDGVQVVNAPDEKSITIDWTDST